MEHSGNIPIFSTPGILFWNILQNFKNNFLRISREHIMGMFHEYSMNIHLTGGKYYEGKIHTDFHDKKMKIGSQHLCVSAL